MSFCTPECTIQRYTYSPLKSGSIRLLRFLPRDRSGFLRCSIVRHALNDSVDPLRSTSKDDDGPKESDTGYVALSYCWGDPTPVGDILLDGKLFAVARNLLDFLEQGGTAADRPMVWIDAVCINQRDELEKSEQVQQMWQIYSYAAMTLAWLGPEQSYTALAFGCMNTGYHKADGRPDRPPLWGGLQGKEYAEFSRHGIPSGNARAALIAISYNIYFTRMWIVQEVARAKYTILCSGQYTAYLSSLKHWSQQLKRPHLPSCFRALSQQASSILENAGPSDAEYHRRTAKFEIRQGPPGAEKTDDVELLTLGFSMALRKNSSKFCGNPRDKAFATLGLPIVRQFDPAGRLQADYSMSVEEVAVATLAYFDLLDCLDGPNYASISRTQKTLGLDLWSDAFRTWLRSRLHWDGEKADEYMTVPSGRSIDTSGPAIRSILRGEHDLDSAESQSVTPHGESEPDPALLRDDSILEWVYIKPDGSGDGAEDDWVTTSEDDSDYNPDPEGCLFS